MRYIDYVMHRKVVAELGAVPNSKARALFSAENFLLSFLLVAFFRKENTT